MVASWEYSPQKEALRLLHTARQIAAGFYKLNGFIVLPFPHAQSTDQIVTFLDLPYLSIPRFWEQVARIGVKYLPGIDVKVPPKLLTAVAQLMPPLPQPNFQAAKDAWEQYESPILEAIYSLIPSKKGSISQIVIWPTILGTGCSFSYFCPSTKSIVIWLRQDKGVAAIVEAILSALTRDDVFSHLGGVWQESEIIVDWLMAYSSLNPLLQAADPNWASNLTIKYARKKQSGSLALQSEDFLQRIGAPIANPAKVDLAQFTAREKEIMELLISCSPRPVRMEQIGEILFKNNPDEYSLFAISKAIQRLRNRLEQNGISGNFIQTKRGEGYLLVS